MLKTRPSLRLTFLVLILYFTSRVNIVVAKRCESEDGRSSTECDDDEECCESDDGEAECCEELGVVGAVITIIMFAGIAVTTLICIICCCKWRMKQREAVRSRTVLVRSAGNNVIVRSAGSFSTPQGTRTVLVPASNNNRNVTLLQMKNLNRSSTSNGNSTNTNDHSNTMSASHEHSNRNGYTSTIDDAPPPYCSDEAPPPYAEIDL